MNEVQYSLKQILSTLLKNKGNKIKKRLIFDQSPIGGISSKWIMVFFISLPILLYIGIFNPVVFDMLGIAQAIIFYIVFLSMVMILIMAVTFINNNKVLRAIKPSWQQYFPDVEIKQVISSGNSPYKAFFSYYQEALDQGLEGDSLHEYLKEAIVKMEEENKDLIEMMGKARNA